VGAIHSLSCQQLRAKLNLNGGFSVYLKEPDRAHMIDRAVFNDELKSDRWIFELRHDALFE
jgi:hypothetical protein